MAVSKAIDNKHAAVRRVQPVHSSKLHQVYELVLSDGRTLELVMPPPSMLRLLRSERQIANSEAVVVQWLSTVLAHQHCSIPLALPGSNRLEDREASPLDPSYRTTSRSSGTPDELPSAEKAFSSDESALLGLLPKLVDFSLTPSILGTQHSIYQPRSGTAIASLPRPLTELERAGVDAQLGRLSRQFAGIRALTGRYGLAAAVLDSTIAVNNDGSRTNSPAPKIQVDGSRTWSEAFNLMFEGVLRDSEDMAIMLAYPIIRKHLARLSYVLDKVVWPSLVFVDGMDDDNVMVDLSTSEGTAKEGSGGGRDNSKTDDDSSDEEQVKEYKSSASGSDTCPDRKPPPEVDTTIRIVGLRDWSNGVFGDPMLATVFSNNPSQELLDGFYGTTTSKESATQSTDDRDASTSTRLLLYQAYHATVSIATEFYRPQGEGTTRELAARRKLAEVLMKLEEVEDEHKVSRHRRPSGEMSPAKKLKSEETERFPSSRRYEATAQKD